MRHLVMAMMSVMALAAASVEAEAQHVSWGLKGGVVFASLDASGEGAFDTSADPGGIVGGFVGVNLGRQVRLQPEVYWSVRRFAASGVPTPFAVTSKGVEVPILVQVRVPDARAWQATLFAGPQLSFVNSVTQEVETTTTDISDLIEDRDLGLVFGAGFERALSSGSLVADVRAVIGMRNLNRQDSPSLKSRGVQLLVGYRFR